MFFVTSEPRAAGISMDEVFLGGAEELFFFSGLVFAGKFFLAMFFSTDFIFLSAGTPAGSPLSSSRAWRLRGMRSLAVG